MCARRRRPWRLLFVTVVALICAACSAPAGQQRTPSPTEGSAASSDYRQLGGSIEKAIASGSVALDTVGAVLINVDGKTVLRHYRTGQKPNKALHVFSVTKSVLSALIGIALDEKLIKDIDSPLGELLPRQQVVITGDMARVRLRQLMTMSAGFEDEESNPSLFGDAIRHNGDAVTFILKRGLATSPGDTFAYSNSSSHLVSAILAEALRQSDGSTPRTVLDYATEKLFKPLGVDTRNPYTARFRPDDPAPFERAGFGWATDAQGIHIGAGNLRLRPADMLSFGQLYLDHGMWKGQQLVPEQWVTNSIAPSSANSRYGLLWWLEMTPSGDSAYSAMGFGGQMVLVVPEHRLVVAVASQPGKDYALTSEDVLALVSTVVLPIFP
jgi:CubicO group peptidase (beta-lactamase class C family)